MCHHHHSSSFSFFKISRRNKRRRRRLRRGDFRARESIREREKLWIWKGLEGISREATRPLHHVCMYRVDQSSRRPDTREEDILLSLKLIGDTYIHLRSFVHMHTKFTVCCMHGSKHGFERACPPSYMHYSYECRAPPASSHAN